MRFHLGSPPSSPDFHPEQSGWTALREPRPALLNLFGLPFSLLAWVLLIVAWNRELTFAMSADSSVVGRFSPWLYILVPLFGLLVVIAAHELIHATGFPNFGFSDSTILAAWPSRFLFYAAYLGGMSRNRWLLVYFLPFLVISLAPIAVYHGLGVYSGWLHAVSLLNGLLAGGDLFCILLIWCQVPVRATLRNSGWSTWWKIEDARDLAEGRSTQ